MSNCRLTGRPNCRRRNGGYKTDKAVTKPKRSLHGGLLMMGAMAARSAKSSRAPEAARRPERRGSAQRATSLSQATPQTSTGNDCIFVTVVDSCNDSSTLVTVVSCRQLSTSTRRLHDLGANCRLTVVSAQTHVLEPAAPQATSFWGRSCGLPTV